MQKKKCVIVGVGGRGTHSYVAPIAKGHLSDVCELCGIYDAVTARSRFSSFSDLVAFFAGGRGMCQRDFQIPYGCHIVSDWCKFEPGKT